MNDIKLRYSNFRNPVPEIFNSWDLHADSTLPNFRSFSTCLHSFHTQIKVGRLQGRYDGYGSMLGYKLGVQLDLLPLTSDVRFDPNNQSLSALGGARLGCWCC